MEFSTPVRMTLIITGGTVLLGLAVVAMLSGSTIDLADIFEKLMAGAAGLAVGLGWGGGKPKPPKVGLPIITLALVVLVSSGCAAREAQRATQSALNAVAGADNVAYQVALEALPEAAERARRQARAQHPECGVDGDCPQAMEMYLELMEPWEDLADGLQILTEALGLAQGIQDAWVATGALPDDWTPLCRGISESVRSVISLLEVCGVDVPDGLSAAPEMVASACVLVEALVERGSQ
jgi:hypothetical protein